jgi:hypothetical protein
VDSKTGEPKVESHLLREKAGRKISSKKGCYQALSPQEYAATTRAKREGTRAGKQFVSSLKKYKRKPQVQTG